jgi:phage baseplate assembly protein W
MATQGYNNLRIGPNTNIPAVKAFASGSYKGFSTVNENTKSVALYDLELIKQDLINNFHIRKGEKLENPEFGTIIWDMLFEPLTAQSRELIVNDVTSIVNSDPRTKMIKTVVTQVEQGLQIEMTMQYLPYNIQETMQFKFDQQNPFV